MSHNPSAVAARALTPSAGYVSGNYYWASVSGAVSTSATFANSTVRVSPWVVSNVLTISKLFMDFSAAGEANSVFRLGVWASNGSGVPATLLLDAGTISTGSGNAGNVATGGTPGTYEIDASLTLSPGLYWVGGAVQGAASTAPTIRTITNFITPGGPLGTSLPNGVNAFAGYQQQSVTGAFPNLTAPLVSTLAPRIGFKVT